MQLVPGIDGLVHISDLSWTEHIDHPGDIYKKGDTVEAVVLAVDKTQQENIIWVSNNSTKIHGIILKKNILSAASIEGKVSKITNFGAFVKLPSGIEGLVHISEVADQKVNKVEDILKVGQKEQFRVINVNKEDRKLGLSLKKEGAAASRN